MQKKLTNKEIKKLVIGVVSIENSFNWKSKVKLVTEYVFGEDDEEDETKLKELATTNPEFFTEELADRRGIKLVDGNVVIESEDFGWMLSLGGYITSKANFGKEDIDLNSDYCMGADNTMLSTNILELDGDFLYNRGFFICEE